MTDSRLQTERAALLLAAALIAVVFVGLLVAAASHRASFAGRYASHSAAADGARGVALLAERLGRPPPRLQHNLASPPDRGTLIAVAPRPDASTSLVASLLDPDPFSPEEAEALLAWIKEGNTLILFTRQPTRLLSRTGIFLAGEAPEAAPGARSRAAPSTVWPPPTEEASPASGGHRLLRGVSRGEVERGAALGRWEPLGDEGRYTPLLVVERGGVRRDVAAEVEVGEGRLIWVGSPFVASNLGLSRADNGLWIALLLDREPGRPLFIDEFHHGFVHRRNLAGYLRRSGRWVVVAQLALLGLLCGWRFGRRFGEPLPTPLSPPEDGGFQTLARVYHHGGHEEHALGVLMDELERALRRRYAPPRGRDLEATLAPAAAERLAMLRRRVQAPREAEPLVDVASSITRWVAQLDQRGAAPHDFKEG
ncbi:MAG: hypothetical protein CMH57_08375 [Myxococcales bacterium]|nr:hypothetical protein [Myxococcales bacterium]